MISKDLVGIIGVVLTFLMFLSGVFICIKIVKQGHTGSISGLPFITGAFSAGMWLLYSLLLNDFAMTVTNLFGVLSQVSYLGLYSIYCVAVETKHILKRQIVAVSLFISAVIYFVGYSGASEGSAKFFVGLLCCVGSICFCASPMAALVEVLKTKSAENLPFPLILLTFLVTVCWGYYGYLIDTPFVIIPNSICAFLAAVQLSLFIIYPSPICSSTSVKTVKKGN